MRDMNKQFEYNGYKFNIKVEFNTKMFNDIHLHTITMKEPKFIIGDEIFFMGVSEPKKGIITGIVRVEGEIDTTGLRHKCMPGKPSFFYSTGAYSLIEEKDAYSSKDELINAVFSKI